MSWTETIGRTASAPAAVAAAGLAFCGLLAAPATALGAGSLSGKVTAAAGGQPLPGIEVCAESVGVTDIRECVETGSDGKYQVGGLEAGNYKVGFQPPAGSGFLPQYYNGKTGSGEANLVLVVNAADIFGIDAALRKEELAGDPVPEAGGGATVALPAPVVAAPAAIVPKPAKTCRRGWRKVRVEGQLRCRRIQRKHQRGRTRASP